MGASLRWTMGGKADEGTYRLAMVLWRDSAVLKGVWHNNAELLQAL
jgi:hypothetical protein